MFLLEFAGLLPASLVIPNLMDTNRSILYLTNYWSFVGKGNEIHYELWPVTNPHFLAIPHTHL